MAKAQGIRAGKAYVELGVSDKLSAGLRRAQKRLRAFGAGLRSIGTRITAIGTSLIAPLAGSIKVFSAAGDQLDKMSKRTGVSVEALSELGFAAEQSGTDLATLEAGIRVMQRTMGDAAQGLATATDAFAALGVTVEQLQGLSPEQQFTLIAERLSQIADPTARAAAAMDVFGRSGSKLLPLLSDGAKGMAELRDQARALGLTVSTQTAQDAALLTDTLNILWRVLKQGVFTIGAALAPTIIDVSKRITRVVVRVSEWIKQNKALIVTALKVAAAVTAGGIALVALGWLIGGVAAGLGGLATIISGVGAALGVVGSVLAAMLSPMGLVIAAVAALGTTLLVVTGAGADALAWLGKRFGSLKDTVFKVIGGISDALAAGDIGLAANILWLTLKLTWQQGVAALNHVWLNAKRFFLSTAQKMFYGALALSEQVLHALEVAWIETTAFLSKTWMTFTAGFRNPAHWSVPPDFQGAIGVRRSNSSAMIPARRRWCGSNPSSSATIPPLHGRLSASAAVVAIPHPPATAATVPSFLRCSSRCSVSAKINPTCRRTIGRKRRSILTAFPRNVQTGRDLRRFPVVTR